MTKALKLDFNKPHGTLHGRLEDRPTAMYEQDGFLFDGAGNVVLTKEEKAEQQKELEAQLAALKASTTTEPPKPADPEVEAEPGLVEIRDGETGDVEVKSVEQEEEEAKKDAPKSTKAAKAGGKGALALPSVDD